MEAERSVLCFESRGTHSLSSSRVTLCCCVLFIDTCIWCELCTSCVGEQQFVDLDWIFMRSIVQESLTLVYVESAVLLNRVSTRSAMLRYQVKVGLYGQLKVR